MDTGRYEAMVLADAVDSRLLYFSHFRSFRYASKCFHHNQNDFIFGYNLANVGCFRQIKHSVGPL
jgi:hypothetical protein